jgi:hypothetical protein
LRAWMRTVLFVSAFSPTLVTLAIVRWDTHGLTREVTQLFVIGVLGALLPLLILRMLAKSGEEMSVTAKKIEPNDFMFVVFIASYALPFLTKASELTFDQVVAVIVASTLVAIYTNYMPSHPVLRICNYRFYKLEADSGMVYTLIAKRDILGVGDVRTVKRISSSMLMESAKK